ncbi:hypothetical protein J6590_092828 [Homalodisca vitripennis]|nr:hypothetical protein J6590_092828 [Homalodisca vitripennis]
MQIPSTDKECEDNKHTSHQHRLQWDTNKNGDVGSFTVGTVLVTYILCSDNTWTELQAAFGLSCTVGGDMVLLRSLISLLSRWFLPRYK